MKDEEKVKEHYEHKCENCKHYNHRYPPPFCLICKTGFNDDFRKRDYWEELTYWYKNGGVTMFEKEAEKHADGIYHYKINVSDYGEDGIINYRYSDVKEAFQKGAEFGYNKANKWHKPSEKLPEECSLVLAYSFDDTEPALWKFVTSDQWEWLPKRIVFCSNDQIRLWKEIVLPELKESE